MSIVKFRVIKRKKRDLKRDPETRIKFKYKLFHGAEKNRISFEVEFEKKEKPYTPQFPTKSWEKPFHRSKKPSSFNFQQNSISNCREIGQSETNRERNEERYEQHEKKKGNRFSRQDSYAFPLTEARNEREFHAETRLPGFHVEMNSGANCSIQVCVGWHTIAL